MAPGFHALFSAVRHGDLERVRYLIEIQGQAAHQHDDWEATPLYYAALCGHQEIITYLLANGARCDEKTFDGERCYYVALNDKIRKLLKEEGFKKGGARGHDLYLDFVQHLLNNYEAHPDIRLTNGQKLLHCHKGILHTRCLGLLQLVQTSTWNDTYDEQSTSKYIPWHYLSPIIKWCYTGRLEIDMDSVDRVIQLLQEINSFKLAKQLQECWEATPGVLGTVVVEHDREDIKECIQYDLGMLLKQGWHHDLEIVVQGGSVMFRAHRAILCSRSQYFATLVSSPLVQAENGIITVNFEDINDRIIFQFLNWAYTDIVPEKQDGSLLLEVLKIADRFLVEGLKSCCTLLLLPFVDKYNSVMLLQEAMRMDNDRLVDICCRNIALNLIQAVKDPHFRSLVQESASSVVERQEVDTLPIIDEIRYHVDQIHADEMSDDEDYLNKDQDFQPSQRQLKLAALEEMLLDMNIEA
eukprot:TRINITY_DN3944_c0_g1_i1.p1 TRINITY_DN3944_c0_g1~~TRINITY_DN3944_c0_g1_i1.p1  ORF type:complete len:483 (+),score=50.95 TRINITY_DN3944_c0_g1_i1:48-1451(+)